MEVFLLVLRQTGNVISLQLLAIQLIKDERRNLGRAGSPMANGSGDFVIAFSTSKGSAIPNEKMSPLFQAAVEATEEAIYNSLFKATAVRGPSGTVDPLPLAETREILRRHGLLR